MLLQIANYSGHLTIVILHEALRSIENRPQMHSAFLRLISQVFALGYYDVLSRRVYTNAKS